MEKTKLRITKEYYGNVILYIPEVYVFKTHWFSEDGWEWESFFFDKYGEYCSYEQAHLPNSTKLLFRDIKVAQHYISEYTKRYLDSPVVWEKEITHE